MANAPRAGATMRIVTQRAYASLKLRTPSCVGLWIKSGRISKAALVPFSDRKGIGIWVERANADLAQNLDPGQQRAQAFPIRVGTEHSRGADFTSIGSELR